MKYGHFDNANKEYVIQRPDTPKPWINYLGSKDFFGMISNGAGGYSFMIDPRRRRLTRYRYNNVPTDGGGRYFYVRDEKTGDFWSPSWMPVKRELNVYECRHGLNYTVITGERKGIKVAIRYFVPVGETLEVWETTVTNTSTEQKTVKLFSFVEFALWEALNDMTNLQRLLNVGEVEIEDQVIYHKSEYRERRSHFAYFATSEKPAGFDTDRDVFLGDYNGFHEPQAVAGGKSFNSVASGWAPCGSHSFEITLAPGESKEINFLLGFFENPENEKFEEKNVVNKKYVKPVIEKYLQRSESQKAFNELKKYWDQLTAVMQVETPDKDVDTMVNIWNQYQCVVTYNMARSTSFFETGIGRGIGFRDACQDIAGAVHLLPRERVRQRIIDLASIQWRNGDCYHQYQMLDKKGNAEFGVGFHDDPNWLIIAASLYLKETGDTSILDQMADFDNNPDDQATLFEHLKISHEFVLNNLGPHKLPLIGRADWNDCLNLTIKKIIPGVTYQADADYYTEDDEFGGVPESLMIAGQFVWASNEFAEIAELKGETELAERARKSAGEMIDKIMEHGWDGDWFIRAYNRLGEKIGSKENKEGKIFIEPQAFMGLAKVGLEDGKLQKAMDSLHERLFCEHGVMVNQPAYTEYDQLLGEITSYPPGVKENAAVFCHPNGWVVISECNLGRGDRAMQYYKTICPAAREEISDVHRLEPYAYAQMIAGPDSPRYGEAKNSWLTGTASANWLGISQYVLGVRPEYKGLRIDPCIPSDWKELKLKRMFRGATYDISIANPNGTQKGVASVTIDGEPHEGNLLPVFSDGKTHSVEVIMG